MVTIMVRGWQQGGGQPPVGRLLAVAVGLGQGSCRGGPTWQGRLKERAPTTKGARRPPASKIDAHPQGRHLWAQHPLVGLLRPSGHARQRSLVGATLDVVALARWSRALPKGRGGRPRAEATTSDTQHHYCTGAIAAARPTGRW
ncbi:hypothetical protein BHE74_00057950 [Ensete ventricosum]|nr:hypothetical protein BHE74_00057950 [Ensete ventricosum]RZS22029.1 hypothetical protein BHM03_00054750 [Ensete ventricosum]